MHTEEGLRASYHGARTLLVSASEAALGRASGFDFGVKQWSATPKISEFGLWVAPRQNKDHPLVFASQGDGSLISVSCWNQNWYRAFVSGIGGEPEDWELASFALLNAADYGKKLARRSMQGGFHSRKEEISTAVSLYLDALAALLKIMETSGALGRQWEWNREDLFRLVFTDDFARINHYLWLSESELERFSELHGLAAEVEVTARNPLFFSTTTCSNCHAADLSGKALCDDCWESELNKFWISYVGKLQVPDCPPTLVQRFQFPPEKADEMASAIPRDFWEGEWLAHHNSGELRKKCWKLLEFESEWDALFLEDREQALAKLTIPGYRTVQPPGDYWAWLWVLMIPPLTPIGFIVYIFMFNQEESSRRSEVVPQEPHSLISGIEREKFLIRKYLEQRIRRLVDETLSRIGQSSDRAEWSKAVGGKWQPNAPLPFLPSREITPREAEEHIRRVVQFLGDARVETTRFAQDGGIDVLSEYLACQVKHTASPVGVKVVRETFGVALSLDKAAAVFSKSGFTTSAKEFAENNGVALISYFPQLQGHSQQGSSFLLLGIKSAINQL